MLKKYQIKHAIIARDYYTGKQRYFEIYGEPFRDCLIIKEIKPNVEKYAPQNPKTKPTKSQASNSLPAK